MAEGGCRAWALRRARRLTGARASKKLMRASKNLGWKEGAAGVVGEKLKDKFGNADGQQSGDDVEKSAHRDGAAPTSDSKEEGVGTGR